MYGFSFVTDSLEAIAFTFGFLDGVRLRNGHLGPTSPFRHMISALSAQKIKEAATLAGEVTVLEMLVVKNRKTTARVAVILSNSSLLFRFPSGSSIQLIPTLKPNLMLTIRFGDHSVIRATKMLCGLVPIIGTMHTIFVDEQSNQKWPERPLGEVLAELLLAQITVPVAS